MPAKSPAGSLDTCFTQTGMRRFDYFLTNNMVYDLALQPDGKVLVGGFFKTTNADTKNNIFRLHPDGTLDTAFDLTGSRYNGSFSLVYDIALQPDGNILLGGNFTSFNGRPEQYICRLQADGTVDTNFAQTGTGLRGFAGGAVSTIAMQKDGKILVGGLIVVRAW